MSLTGETVGTVYIIPQLHDLVAQWQICDDYRNHPMGFCDTCQGASRTYRLLIDWQRKGKLKKHLVAELPDGIRQAYDIFRNGSPDLSTVIPPPGESKESFADWLIIAWCIRRADHDRALAVRQYATQLDELIKCGTDQQVLLDLTYVPEEIIQSVPRRRAAMFNLRQEVGTVLMSHKQKVAKDIPSRFRDEQPLNRDQEEAWAAQWGFDKATDNDSKQTLWSLVFVPLTGYLHQYVIGRKLDSWKKETRSVPDAVFEQASKLIHYRYPDLWGDHQWQRVKARCRKYLSS